MPTKSKPRWLYIAEPGIPCRYTTIRGWRRINGKNYHGNYTIRAHGWNNFIVRDCEVYATSDSIERPTYNPEIN